MVREFAISVYLIVIKALFTMFKLFPQRDKTVCIASFGDNIFYTTRELRKASPEPIIILKQSSCQYPFDPSIARIYNFRLTKPLTYMRSIYHLATATTILVDNYVGLLSVTSFKKNTTCIQLWHATGALKRFGLQDPSNRNRSQKAINRFHQVYQRFDFITVGSDKMAKIFSESFELSNEVMVRTGVPRTDFFYSREDKLHAALELKEFISLPPDKKVILYAPTFRDNQLDHYDIQLDLHEMHAALSDEYILLIKHHPAVSYTLEPHHQDFIYDVTSYYNVNHLLLVTDILITDYSSIPCEFSLLQKPIIFYTYDLEEYSHKNGLPDDYLSELPGPLTFTTEEVISTIQLGNFDSNKIAAFANVWNKYSKGNSSQNLTNFIMEVKKDKRNVV
ncbi:CDP-glycerol glycerophosphotransferase family protein [Ornithinibacillus californiensis]|uniref:CDP-glycerol glycerophosphotransferase family protein n=1 Tax=Ornithinibacillus californiensis TaxID=161536 RepID=UPI00064DFECA|nr:CDP-glycerol glycerophosphotransferase family protein [Ornithinibacillus californiensis]